MPCEGTAGDWGPAEHGCETRASFRLLLREVGSSECVYSSIEGEERKKRGKELGGDFPCQLRRPCFSSERVGR